MRARSIIGFIVFFFISHVVCAQFIAQDTAKRDAISEATARAQIYLAALRDAQNLPGLSVAVSVGNELVFSEGLGWADIENRVPVLPHTKFRVASLSKPLTSAALGQLHENGLLDLDAPIRNYIPWYPAKSHDFSARQLAGHLAGIRHYKEEGFFNRKYYATVRESLEIFQNDDLLHQPGTRRRYSSYGYVLLSAVLEAASGTPFLEYMQTNVFDRAGLKSTVPDRAESIIRHRARFYDRSQSGSLNNAPAEDYSYKWAAGGFLSTAEDLALFGQAMLNGTLVKRVTSQLLFTPQTTVDGKSTKDGMGWRSAKDWNGRSFVHHGGSSEGSRAFLLVYPEQRLSIALLANRSGANLFEAEAETLASLFLDPSSPAVSPGLAGTYEFTATIGEKEVKGSFNLNLTNGRYVGRMTQFHSKDVAIIDVNVEGGGLRLVVATASGFVNIWLKHDDKRLIGKWGWDQPKSPFSAQRILEPTPSERK